MKDSYVNSAGRTGPANAVDRLPPHSVEVEAAVLGIIIHSPAAVVQDMERSGIDNQSFYDLRHKAIFRAVKALLREKLMPDQISVYKRLRDEKQEEAIIQCLTLLPSVAEVLWDHYVTQLHDLRWRRKVAECATTIQNCAHDPTEPMDLVAVDLERVLELTRQKTAPGLTMRRPDEILAMSFDNNDCYVGDRLIAAGQCTTILGPGGIGKSRLLLQLAAACVTGRDFLGLPTFAQGKRWVILQAENTNRRLRNDLEPLRQWMGEEGWKKFTEQVMLHTLETEADSFLSLEASASVTAMETAVARHEPDIVAVDALYNFASGDLNSDAEMRRTLQFLTRIARKDDPKRALVILHHALTGKAGVGKAVGFERASYGRNSKVLHAWTRAQMNIALGSAEDNGSLIVSCGKNNNGQEFKRFAVRLDTDRMIYEVDRNFDWDAWQEQLQDAKPLAALMDTSRVRELCATPVAKAALAKTIMGDIGCTRSSAYRYIERAEDSGQIRFNESDQVYLAC